jgi:histidine phosphotransfer protein HptB
MSNAAIIDSARLAKVKERLGARFWPTLSLLQQEGERAVDAIEAGLRRHDPVSMVEPADRLKTDALTLGADSLAEIAEDIEFAARDCIEWHQDTTLLIESVVRLRSVYVETVEALSDGASPLKTRDPAQLRPLLAA